MPEFGDAPEGAGRYQYEGQRDPNDVALGPAEWAEYQRKRKRDALFGVLSVLGATTGLGALGGAVGGAGAAGQSVINGGVISTAAPTFGGAAGAGVAAGAGAAGAAGAAGSAARGAASGVGAAAGGLNARDVMALIAAAGGTIGGALSKPQNTAPTSATTDPNMDELIKLMQGRLRKSEPMFDSVQSMANGMLPTAYQNGGKG